MSFLSTLFTAAAIVAVDYFTLGAATAYQMAVTFAVSIVASRIFAPNVPQAQQNNIRQQVPPDPTAGIPLVYGDAYTGGRFCDAVLTTDQKSMYYVMVISCISPNGQFSFDTSKFYYQDQIITFDTTDLTKVVSLTDQAGNVDTSISGHLYINLYTSSQTGTITPINTSNQPSAVMSTANGIPSGQEWVSSGRQMNGTAFAIVQLVYNANSLGTTSLQPITFHVSHYLNGAGCAKPGDVWYDYMTNTVYGAAVQSQFVSSASATALNAYSDELITYTPAGGGSASIPRYRFNGVLDTGQTALSNIDLMMNCCDCWQSYQVSTGLWTAVINKAISPTFAFDDTNIISDITVGELDITQMINQIEARFVDSGNRDQPGYVNLQTPSGLLLPNEPVNKFTISYDLVNNSVTAQYLANRVLEQNRLDLIVSFSTNYTGIQVNAGDVVTVTNSYYGWSNQQFRVMQVKEVSLPDGSLGASLQMIQYDPNVYATSSITAYTPTSHSGLAAPTFFSSLAAPTVTAHFETANIPYFNVQVFVPVTGRVTNGTLYYTTVATPSGSDWKVWANVQTANSLPVPNNSYYTFVDVVLPAGTYYFAYTVGSGTSLSTLSPISAAFVWAPTGLSGVSGYSGASGYSGFSGSGTPGLMGLTALTAYQLVTQTASTPPSFTTPTTGPNAPTGWSLTAPTATVGNVVWYIMGQYNANSVTVNGVPSGKTAWTGPVAASVFQDIESDNWNGGTPPTTGPFSPLGTSGYYIQKSTGNMYLNSIYGRGIARFDGATSTGSGSYAAIVANLSLSQSFGLYGTTNVYNGAGVYGFDQGTGTQSSGIYGGSSNPNSYAGNFYNYSGGNGVLINVTGSGTGLNIGGSSGTGINIGTVSGPAIQAVSLTGYGLQLSGKMTINNSTLVNNLNAQNWNGISVTGFVSIGTQVLTGFIQVSYAGGTYYLPYYT